MFFHFPNRTFKKVYLYLTLNITIGLHVFVAFDKPQGITIFIDNNLQETMHGVLRKNYVFTLKSVVLLS